MVIMVNNIPTKHQHVRTVIVKQCCSFVFYFISVFYISRLLLLNLLHVISLQFTSFVTLVLKGVTEIKFITVILYCEHVSMT